MKKKTVLAIIVWVLFFLSALLDEVLPANIINNAGYILLNTAIVVFLAILNILSIERLHSRELQSKQN